MMMRWLGEPEVAGRIGGAVQKALASGAKTPDLGGSCGTAEVTGAVVGYLNEVGRK
jgi:isocitrate/isopropylmalate dehydrogenase